MPRNYHTYDETSKDVSSPVVSLSYEDKDNEQTITVSNLKNYIEYFLPAPNELPEAKTYSVNVTGDTWAYHKLVVSSKEEAVSIEVTPFNCSHKLHLFVRENRHPTKDKFAWKKVIWQPSNGDRSTLNYTSCFEEYSSYTLFVSNTKLRNSTYFIGIWYAGEKEDTGNSNETVGMKYSIRVYKSKCLYWNENKETWMGDGCVVSFFLSLLFPSFSTRSSFIQYIVNTLTVHTDLPIKPILTTCGLFLVILDSTFRPLVLALL